MLKKAITIILALAMMSVTSVFASNETEESNNATQIGECEKKSVKNNPSMIEYK
ncbi:Uncharacterised protein [uncultured Clostridium sp.]|nr:Uncharacterised protein [uncultured Clostridium sp.]